MCLPSILLAVSALALLACDSALAVVADANEGTKVSMMASPDLNGLDTSHSAKRSLRGLGSVDDDDDERWAGAKLFDATKLEKAMTDPKYAETLMMRWWRHGFDIEDTKFTLNASKFSKDPRLNAVYHRYAAWLDKHFSRVGLQPTGGDDLFNKAKIEKALGDGSYAKTLFREWKTHDHESGDILKKLKALGLRRNDGDVDKLFKNYASWLNVHYPNREAKDLAKAKLLFEDTMLL